jgi:hypothetical protein
MYRLYVVFGRAWSELERGGRREAMVVRLTGCMAKAKLGSMQVTRDSIKDGNPPTVRYISKWEVASYLNPQQV